MTKPSSQANRHWLGLLLAALTGVLITLFGAGTGSVAAADAAQTRVGPHTLAAQVVVGPHSGIGADQRLGNDLPAYDSALATGVAAKSGGSLAGRLGSETIWTSGKLPFRNGPANGLLSKRGPSGEISNYSEYGSSGYITKRVDLKGRSHAGIPTPHTVDYVHDVNPAGAIFPRGLPVRAATPDEIP